MSWGKRIEFSIFFRRVLNCFQNFTCIIFILAWSRIKMTFQKGVLLCIVMTSNSWFMVTESFTELLTCFSYIPYPTFLTFQQIYKVFSLATKFTISMVDNIFYFLCIGIPDDWLFIKYLASSTSVPSTFLWNLFFIFSSWVISSLARFPLALANSSFSSIRSSSATDPIFDTDIPACSISKVTSYTISCFCHIGVTLEWMSISSRAINPWGGY